MDCLWKSERATVYVPAQLTSNEYPLTIHESAVKIRVWFRRV